MKKKSSLLRGVGMTALLLTVFCFFRLLLISQRENINLYIGLGTFVVALSMLTVLTSLLFYLFDKRKHWLSYSIDVFMLVGGGIFCWELSSWESDMLLYTGVAIFLIILACAISILRFFQRLDVSFAISEERMEIHYFFSHAIWFKILTFLFLFSFIEFFLVPLAA